MKSRVLSALLLTAAVCSSAEFAVTPEIQEALDRISADSLRGHVSFLASDLLEGRATPSAGLDIAAEYVAAQFRRAGLEPAGDEEYFQTARLATTKPNYAGFELTVEINGKTIRVPPENVAIGFSVAGIELTDAPAVKTSYRSELQDWETASERATVALTDLTEDRLALVDALERERGREGPRAPAAVIALTTSAIPRKTPPRLYDPEDPATAAGLRIIRVSDPELQRAYAAMKEGESGAKVTLKVAAPVREDVTLRNVAGVLRGSDPKLKRTYVLVSAHYDHIGICAGGADRICNGADDDASGVASAIELASTLARMRERPKRSFLFVTYFGEEEGLYGSRYYGRHPLVPLDKTVADINLEQLGRTDDVEGSQIGRASLTGFDYSDIGATFVKAGTLAGIEVRGSGRRSDTYFARSDNQALADKGVPAHTVLVAYEFGDYHEPGDEWQKLDYPNMQKVDRMIALGLLMIANDPQAPRWNESNVKTRRYVRAWKERKGN